MQFKADFMFILVHFRYRQANTDGQKMFGTKGQ